MPAATRTGSPGAMVPDALIDATNVLGVSQ